MPELQTSTAENTHAEAPAGVLGTLGINATQLVAQLVHFIIILLIMWRWVYRPLMKKMDERSQKIAEGLAFSETAEKQLAQALHDKDRIIREAQTEVRRLMEEANVKAEALRHEKLVQTKKEIEVIVAETKEQIANERNEAYRALQGDIANLVTLATEKVIKNLDEQSRRSLVAQAVKQVEQEQL